MTVKEALYIECKSFIKDRLNSVQEIVSNIQESLQSETKSSAGDKHETGRAMLQLEREKVGKQLAEIRKQEQILAKVVIDQNSDVVRLGSLVYTSNGIYFISISKGVIEIEGKNYFAVSSNAPIGKLLLGKRKGNSIEFNGRGIIIENIE